MRITFVAHVFPPEPDPTAVMADELVRGWEEAGHEVLVVSPFPNRPGGEIYPGFRRRLFQRGVHGRSPHVRVPTWLIGRDRKGRNRVLENASFGVASAVACALTRKPDVLVLESWPILAYLPVLAVAMARGIPVINYVQDVYPEAAVAGGIVGEGSAAARVLLALHRWVCRVSARNVAISDGMADMLARTRGLPRDRFTVIPNWLDLSAIRPHEGPSTWRAENGIGDDEFVAMFAGTLGIASGADVLVEVAERLRDVPRIRIVCVGDGVHRAAMAEAIERRGLTNLTLLPFQPRARVAEVQSQADAMLLTTSADMGLSSVPSKLVTYLAVGKPVVCAAAPDTDIARLVDGERLGATCAPGDPDSLAAAIRQLADCPKEALAAMGARSRATAVRSYSREAALAAFERLFASMAPGAAPADEPVRP